MNDKHDPNQPPRENPAYTEPRIPPPPEKPGSGIGTDPERPTSPGTPRSAKAEDVAKQQKEVDKAAGQLQPTNSFDPLAKGTPEEQQKARDQRAADEADRDKKNERVADEVRSEIRPGVVNRPVGPAAERAAAERAANDRDNNR